MYILSNATHCTFVRYFYFFNKILKLQVIMTDYYTAIYDDFYISSTLCILCTI